MDKLEKMQESLNKNLPEKKAPKPETTKSQKEIKDDYEFSRKTYKDLIETGVRSLDVLAELARESEHPRAFEVLSNHIRNMSEVTDKLMKLQKAKKELTKEEGNKRVTNNNVFVGSTTDLQRMLLNKDDNIIDVEPDKE